MLAYFYFLKSHVIREERTFKLRVDYWLGITYRKYRGIGDGSRVFLGKMETALMSQAK